MTNNIKGVCIVFDDDMHEEDAIPIIHAIEMIKGVGAVEASVVNADDWMNRKRISREFERNILNAFK